MIKKIAVGSFLLVLLAACSPKDENADKLFEISSINTEEVEKMLIDERVEALAQEKYKNEVLKEVIAIELTKENKGTEILTLSTDDNTTYFRVFKRTGKEIEVIWEKETENPIESSFYVDSIMPDVYGEKNFIVIGTHKNPGMYLTYFVVGENFETKEIEITYDNHFEKNEPVYIGEIAVNESMLLISEDGMNEYQVKWDGEKFIKGQLGH